MVDLPHDEKIENSLRLLISTQYTNVTDGQTDTARRHRPPLQHG